MVVKPDTTDINSSPTTSAATSCGNCGAEEQRLLHHVRHCWIFRRLCTSCVLRLHPQSFCPTCFQLGSTVIGLKTNEGVRVAVENLSPEKMKVQLQTKKKAMLKINVLKLTRAIRRAKLKRLKKETKE